MANLPETDNFDAGVYQIETTDAVIGGVGGKSNAGAINLANRTNYLKKRIEKMLTKSVAGAADVVLTASEANHAILKLTGVLTGNINVVVPVDAERRWIIYNNTSGAYSLVVKPAAGNGVLAPQGLSTDIYTDGTDVKSAAVADGQAGQIAFFAKNTPPAGWLKANGAALSRTAYAALFSAIGTTFGIGDGATTFNLPDLRANFARGWDDGRGIDVGRVFGSSQSPYAGYLAIGTSTFAVTNGSTPIMDAITVQGYTWNDNTGIVTVDVTPGDDRPFNVALLACIKF